MPHDSRPTRGDADSSDHESARHDTGRAFGPQWWDRHYQQSVTATNAEPSPYLTNELAGLSPGTALDAGCGTGADAIWFARNGWDVTAVDISPSAITRAREHAARQAPDVTQHITWVRADLSSWEPPHRYDLVLSQYVHPDVPFEQFIKRLATAVAPNGTLMVVGHDHSDSHSTAHAPRDASIGIANITDILGPGQWRIEIAETRFRRTGHTSNPLTLADTVIKACRQTASSTA